MPRKASPILDPNDNGNWWFVVTWLARRFDEELIDSTSSFVISAPVAAAIDAGLPVAIDDAHVAVRESWRTLQQEWVRGWEREASGKLKDAEEYFVDLAKRTSEWIEQHFPSDNTGVGWERARLLAAVRQQRLRERRKAVRNSVQVSISGDLYKALRRRFEIPDSKQHDVVRASLQIVLNTPELLARAKQLAGVTT